MPTTVPTTVPDIFFYKSTCDTCRKALKLVRELRPGLEERNFSKTPLSRAEIERVLDLAGSVGAALNAYNKTVRANGWKASPPPRAEYVEAVLGDNNLIRRPMLIVGDEVVIGRNEEAYGRLLA